MKIVVTESQYKIIEQEVADVVTDLNHSDQNYINVGVNIKMSDNEYETYELEVKYETTKNGPHEDPLNPGGVLEWFVVRAKMIYPNPNSVVRKEQMEKLLQNKKVYEAIDKEVKGADTFINNYNSGNTYNKMK